MNKRTLCIVLIFSSIYLSSKAQVEKEVEVRKTYIPEIESATKLRLQPDMVDTVQIRPEIDYTITPTSVETNLSPRLYKPATVTYWEFNRPKRGYVKAGIGYPLASVADVYVSNSNPNTNYVIGYANHNGKWGKIINDYNQKVSALNTQNRVGAAAGMVVAERALEGEVSYDVDVWSRSATAHPVIERSLYQTVSLAARYGDEFIDLSKLNFNISINADRFFDREDNNNTTVGGALKMGRQLKQGELVATAGYDYICGSDKYLNNSLFIGAIYSLSLYGWDWDLGLKYYNDIVSLNGDKNPSNYLVPDVCIKRTSNKKIQPFVKIGGALSRNNYETLATTNPYIVNGEAMDVNSVSLYFRGGISGVLGNDKLSYSLFGDYTTTSNALYWALCEEEYSSGCFDNYYIANCGELKELSINFDLKYRPLADLTVTGGGSATHYMSLMDVSVSKPAVKLYAGGEYAIKRVLFGIKVDFNSAIYTPKIVSMLDASTITSDVKISPTINLNAFAEYKLKNDMILFAEADNLTNSKQYAWAGYREYGVNVMAGVKFQF
ncbi:MAG: hypothetical protein SNH35_00575 [Rikenellaceae bacterium]